MTRKVQYEANGGVYFGLGALLTVGGTIFAYVNVPEVEGEDLPLTVASLVATIGFYGLYLWLQIIRDHDEPADDWLLACMLTALPGGLSLGVCIHSHSGWSPWIASAPVVTILLLWNAVTRCRQ